MQLDTKQLKTIKLLYVEDDPGILEQVELLYSKIFQKLYIAQDGVEGLERFKENIDDIDIVVSDISMPNMNGLDMAKEMLTLKPNLPLVLTTAHTDSSSINTAMKLNIDKYIPKPVQFKSLTMTIVELVLRYRKNNQLETLAKGLAAKSSKTDQLALDLKQQLELSSHELNYYKMIVDNFVITFQTDKLGNITECSNKFCSFFEYNQDEIIGKNINILRCESCTGTTFQQNMLQAVHTKKSINTQHTFTSKSDKKIVGDLTMTPKYDEQSLVNGYVFYIDIIQG